MVKKLPKTNKKTKQRSASGWSLLLFWKRSTKQKPKTKKKAMKQSSANWRAKQHRIKLSGHSTLIITRRKFRTNPARRSTRSQQFVVTVNNYPFKVREVAFCVVSKSRRGRPRVAKRPARRFIIRPQLAVPIILIIFGLGGTLFFGLQAVNGNRIEPVETYSLPTPSEPPKPVVQKPKGLSESLPTQVRIARLGIDYPTMQVGKLADETMETPPTLEKITGWYKYSPTPGEVGPAIIVGHVDSYRGPSVFWRLREVVPGDIIEVAREDGRVVKFKVDGLEQFDQNAFPTEKVYGNTSKPTLRLITCGGTFNRTIQRYSHNTVVFATILEEELQNLSNG